MMLLINGQFHFRFRSRTWKCLHCGNSNHNVFFPHSATCSWFIIAACQKETKLMFTINEISFGWCPDSKCQLKQRYNVSEPEKCQLVQFISIECELSAFIVSCQLIILYWARSHTHTYTENHTLVHCRKLLSDKMILIRCLFFAFNLFHMNARILEVKCNHYTLSLWIANMKQFSRILKKKHVKWSLTAWYITALLYSKSYQFF